MEKKTTSTKLETRSTDNNSRSVEILQLKEWLDKTIENMDAEHPEWRKNKTYWTAYDGEDGESLLSVHYYRYMTEKELQEEEYRKKMIKENSVRSMKMLIRSNFEEAVAFMEELKHNKKA